MGLASVLVFSSKAYCSVPLVCCPQPGVSAFPVQVCGGVGCRGAADAFLRQHHRHCSVFWRQAAQEASVWQWPLQPQCQPAGPQHSGGTAGRAAAAVKSSSTRWCGSRHQHLCGSCLDAECSMRWVLWEGCLLRWQSAQGGSMAMALKTTNSVLLLLLNLRFG